MNERDIKPNSARLQEPEKKDRDRIFSSDAQIHLFNTHT